MTQNDCHKHPNAETYEVEHSGELTPTKTFHCEQCDIELGSTNDGESVSW